MAPLNRGLQTYVPRGRHGMMMSAKDEQRRLQRVEREQERRYEEETNSYGGTEHANQTAGSIKCGACDAGLVAFEHGSVHSTEENKTVLSQSESSDRSK